jgi:hypothetical protein
LSQRKAESSNSYGAENECKTFNKNFANNFVIYLGFYLPVENVQQFDHVETIRAMILAGEVAGIHFDFANRRSGKLASNRR